MKCADFQYHRPESLAQALRLLNETNDACLLAGGQSLVPLMNFRLASPKNLIDLNHINELNHIKIVGQNLHIGAMTRQRSLEYSNLIQEHLPVLKTALLQVGHRQTRNRGTIGGSLCHLDPSAELVAICALTDAIMNTCSLQGRRQITSSNWALGLMTNALHQGEILEYISIPINEPSHGHAYVEYARRHGDFAIVAVGTRLWLGLDQKISKASIVLSGISQSPIRLKIAEIALQGVKPNESTWQQAAQLTQQIPAMQDEQITSEYRQHLARILTYRSLESAYQMALSSPRAQA